MLLKKSAQVPITLAVCFSGYLMGMQNHSPGISLLLVVCALVSMIVTDFKKVFWLNTRYSNLLAFVILLGMLPSFFNLDSVVKVFASISQLLSWLEILILFRLKSVYSNYLLLLLSLQQVIVAAVFPQGFLFGIVLFCYFLSAIYALYLLSALRRQQVMIKYETPNYSLFRPVEFRTKTPLCRDELQRFFLPRHWFRGLVFYCIGILMIGSFFFLLIPRATSAGYQALPETRKQAEVGFRNEIQLGDLGRMLQNHTEVMQVELHEVTTDFSQGEKLATGQLPPILYLRGAVLTQYSNGHWKQPPYPMVSNPSFTNRQFRMRHPPRAGQILTPPKTLNSKTLTWIDFRCSEQIQGTIFGVWPFYGAGGKFTRQIYFDPFSESLKTSVRKQHTQLNYSLLTQAIGHNQQLTCVPCFTEFPKWEMLKPPLEGDFPQLTRLAREWLDDLKKRNPECTMYDIATEFQRRLSLSDDFHYSLKPQNRDWNIDPVEDFIRNNPSGHCEFFASALALMLRVAGVPSRVVVGFATNEILQPGNVYIVRQSNAHAWTEVWIDPDSIPDFVKENAPWNSMDWQAGAMLRLDATPMAYTESETGYVMSRLIKYYDWAESLWNTYVMRLNRSRQNSSLYNLLSQWWQEKPRAFFEWVQKKCGFVISQKNVDRMFLWTVRLLWTSVFLCVFGAVFITVGKRLSNWNWTLGKNGRKRNRDIRRHDIAFYKRLERTLARRGFHRQDAQTALEFIQEVELKTQTREYSPLVQRYYRMRFGKKAE